MSFSLFRLVESGSNLDSTCRFAEVFARFLRRRRGDGGIGVTRPTDSEVQKTVGAWPGDRTPIQDDSARQAARRSSGTLCTLGRVVAEGEVAAGAGDVAGDLVAEGLGGGEGTLGAEAAEEGEAEGGALGEVDRGGS